MIFAAAVASVLRGSARAAVSALSCSSCWMPASSAMAIRTMSRPSSERPILNTRTRGEAAANARAYAYAVAESTNSPGAPAIRCRNLLGDGTVDDAGTYDTQGDENRGSVVARAISSLELGSGVSGATVNNTGAPGAGSGDRRGSAPLAHCRTAPCAALPLHTAAPASADRRRSDATNHRKARIAPRSRGPALAAPPGSPAGHFWRASAATH